MANFIGWLQREIEEEHPFGQRVERVRVGQKGIAALAEVGANEVDLMTAWATRDVLGRRGISSILDRVDGHFVPLLIDPDCERMYVLEVGPEN